ncbi:MAG: ATP-dependent RecD-like DNA helicase [Desulfomicrobium sp.]|nr:ATP-dependent RecD-like DNA helicase [Pseudomonadota bacterium]MBV1711155.1 ATP-dependent RecD-like DNA helicase [Desulfomicrobium sp.]MBU4569826.1 ATP-dependent RecD-like DNA helicase [Pseudomonadota bacterium]MBU4594924.1 ATP-dependent RecD-like DNA helicase [Pseudomonadota bacterium]MBV1718955.1 ATP-dependent RecD-like DNA helicase [Desulfomicrobium sp.]
MHTLKGEVVTVVYHNPENGYVIARVDSPSEPGQINVVGLLGDVAPGESLRMTGDWVEHSKFGRQFKAESCEHLMPASLNGIRRFLGSGAVKGIGEKTADRMISRFGSQVLDIMDSDPERLLEVEGIGVAKLKTIVSSWQEKREVRGLMLFLQTHGVATTFAHRIFRHYGVSAVQRLRANPYDLAYDIHGIGFRTADEVALKLGFAEDAPQRLEAGVEYCLRQTADGAGHMFLPRPVLAEEAAKLLGCHDLELIEEQIDALVERKRLVTEPLPEKGVAEAVYLSYFYRTEREIASRLRGLLDHVSRIDPDKISKAVAREEARQSLTLSQEQREAVESACGHKVSIITGGPGTGKTTITRVVVRALKALGLKISLAAPTGRAAKRLAEATGFTATTLHRLLRYQPATGFEFNEEKKLSADVMVVDEVSMLDCGLCLSLLRALPLTCRLVFVGDENQLPSVGAGNVLGDMIESGVIPAVRLTHIYRQARESMIVVNAHRINEGEFPLGSPHAPPKADFFWVEKEDLRELQALILRMVCERIPEAYGLDPMSDVQVLTPMHKGEVGTIALNSLLQERLNAGGRELVRGQRAYRVGDRILQLRNNYDKEVFNGDLGRILDFDTKDEILKAEFDGREVEYGFDELDEIGLAYAISVHKSQGSEYPAVVMPVVSQHYMLLQKNLIYTGLTRARKLAVLMGSRRAMHMGLGNERGRQRHSSLAVRLAKEAQI